MLFRGDLSLGALSGGCRPRRVGARQLLQPLLLGFSPLKVGDCPNGLLRLQELVLPIELWLKLETASAGVFTSTRLPLSTP